MSHALLEELRELYAAGQYRRIVEQLRRFVNDELPADIDLSIVVDAILRTFRPDVYEAQLWDTAALIWQLERQGILDQNNLDNISNSIGETFQAAKRKPPFCLSSTELIRELQQLHEQGQHSQILQRLRQYKIDRLPSDIDVSIAVEAIIRTFRSSSDKDDIERATGLKWQLERQKLLNPNDSDKIFNALAEAYLNANGELPSLLVDALLSPHDEVVPENLIRIYIQARTRDAQFVLAHWIGASYKEQGFLVLVHNLYAQRIIVNDRIHAILEKYPLLAGVSLEPDEREAITSAMLNYLEILGHKIENMQDEKNYEIESINRTSAARILVVLNRHPYLTKESMVRIESRGHLIVTYHCIDRMYDAFEGIPLSRYLSGGIN